MRSQLSIALIAIFAASTSAQNDGDFSPPSYPSPWMNGKGDWADAYSKAKKFVSQLTVLEKVNLTTGVGWEGESCVGNTGSIPRLNFPGLCLQDSPLGIRFADFSSAFPSGMNAAATWSYDLINARGYAMGKEHRGKGVDVQLGPVAGPLGRVPEGGRNWEGFSPDPVLTGISMAATVEGIQDAGVIACAKHFIMNEQEHFREPGGSNAAYSANLDDKTMHELYLWPFADAVRAGAGAVMCSYNRINQSYGSENSWTLNYLLKNELDFQGFVVSDWWAQHSGVASALAGLDMTMAGDQNLASGNTYWGTWLTNAVLNGTVPQWRLDDMAVRIMSAYYKIGRDTAKVPVNFNSWNLSTYGYQHPLANEDFTQINQHINVQDNHAALIREIGAKSTVLLKNTKGALPLDRPRSIAIIGEDAHDNPGGPNACGDRGCNIGTLAMGWGSGTANFPYLIAPVTALKAQAAKDHTAIRNVSNNYDFAAVAAAAEGASAAIVFANANGGEAYITVDGNQGDRNNLTLWGNGDALIDYVASINKNTIIVLHTIGPVIVEAYKNHPNVTAILWAGLPGQESGNSITDVLYGEVNPQAKSVFTWGKSREDYGVDVEYTVSSPDPQLNFNEGVFIDYRHFDAANIEPSYEFGFGLSYTTFSYSNLRIQRQYAAPYIPTKGKTSSAPTFGKINYNASAAQFPPGFHKVPLYVYPYLDGPLITNQSDQAPPHSKDSTPQPLLAAGGEPGGNPGLYDVLYTVSAKVTNTGKVSGTEIPQLYISLGGPTDPKVVLRAFDDMQLERRESDTFTYGITRRDISNWDPVNQNWFISSYPKKVYVGSSSRSLVLSATLQ
ncbi:glycoside hydrolase family 3 protein [Sclerotinia borealis F-4128]|uniref:beta-glucosidase n=1 Tax=Sclerotinia borealis (strain F-4128) TaxID=1432307 RepID=W9C6B5_SCLBF|nr:glycoside hydrolase family 3 protein [Sclerotinia borealis F-4128]